jgi:signal transduction histidine kinase
MNDKIPGKPPGSDYRSYRDIKQRLKVIFACLTAIPFVVFAFIYFRIGAVNTALSASLITLSLILILEGFIIFRRMADHIEQISSAVMQPEREVLKDIQKSQDTKELAMIADAFSRTLSKLENTAKELGVKAVQSSTLNEIREIVSKTIHMEEIAKSILEKAINAVASDAGFLAVRRGKELNLHIAAISGAYEGIKEGSEIDAEGSITGRVVRERAPLVIENIEKETRIKEANIPDTGLPRLLYVPIVAKKSTIGVLVLGRGENQPPYRDEDVQFLQTLLQQVAYNFENARLYEDLQQSNRELTIALDSEKKAQEQVLASTRMAAFGELAVNVAHELNNPLTGILGYADLNLGPNIDEEDKIKNLKKIRDQALRASQITRNLVDFAGDKHRSETRTDLNTVIQETLLLTKGKMCDSGIRFTLQLGKHLPPVYVDRTRIEQVFVHLIDNAINAMTDVYRTPSGTEEDDSKTEEKQPLLKINTGRNDKTLYVSFEDNGSGISIYDLPHIFEPFYSTQEKVTQVGLGLWVCHWVVTAHGGRISVQSASGKGSLFTVELPVTDETEEGGKGNRP